jgi:hypothetical protein
MQPIKISAQHQSIIDLVKNMKNELIEVFKLQQEATILFHRYTTDSQKLIAEKDEEIKRLESLISN